MKNTHAKFVRVDEYSALENSTDVTNLLDDEFKISMKNTGGDAYWINGKNEIHKKSIHNMVREGLLDNNHNEKNGDVQQKQHQRFIYA